MKIEQKIEPFRFSSKQGSSHILNKERASLEMEMINFNPIYKSLLSALYRDSRALIISQLCFATLEAKQKPFAALVDVVSTLAHDKPVHVNKNQLSKANDDLENVLSCMGSMTTPPSQEAVVWIMPRRIYMTDYELQAFHKLALGDVFRRE